VGTLRVPPTVTRVSSPSVSAIAVTDLRKAYGQREVLHGLSFTVETGEVFALLGPNGAGKTTTVEILEGYRRRDGGEVRVLGVDPERGGRGFKARIGIVLQSSAVYQLLSVREIVSLFAGYYPNPRPADEVIELVGLAEKRDARVRTLSGGQLRRLDLALALVGDPELVFLDEPTTGFDPAARRQAWDTIRDLRSLGKSILLTTHYMEEAQRLADRVAILRGGEIVGTGSPEELLSGHASVEIRYRRNGTEVVVATEEPTRVLHEITAEALAAGVELEGLEVHRRSLEDVYLELTREEASE
jgi:ABC-2 type transport system ATP-binding protein